ncbi:MAG: DivIVA domain-containing protein [Oscillospiraceae bacterium]
MTPQDIREKTFEKAMFGGYDMAAVQNYQEEVATELANAQKEIAVLKGKMKVLVDKIEEYRASEDAMRLAILSAQKVGKQIEDDAQARADKILSEAKNTSDRILGGLQHETANEEAKLLNAKTSCAKFLEDVRNLCLTQLEYLDGVAGSKAASAPRAAARPNASAAPAEPAPAAPAEPVPAAQPEAPAAGQPVQAEPVYAAETVSAAPVEAQPVEADDAAADSAADDATQLYHFLHNS